MLAVRYVTLVALVVWLGGLVAMRLVAAPSSSLSPQFQLVGLACGAIILAGLLVLKFVGPPPHAFLARMALVVAMLAVAIYSEIWPASPAMPQAAEIAFGLVLLFWYVRE